MKEATMKIDLVKAAAMKEMYRVRLLIDLPHGHERPSMLALTQGM